MNIALISLQVKLLSQIMEFKTNKLFNSIIHKANLEQLKVYAKF